MIIFCCTEFHRVLHGVTQSFFFSFVLLCDNFLLHRVSQSFARSYTEFFFPFVLLCVTFLLHIVSQSIFSPLWYSVSTLWHSVKLFFIAHSLSERFFPLCYSVNTLWYSVKLFFSAHSLSECFFSSVLLCEYSVALCETKLLTIL